MSNQCAKVEVNDRLELKLTTIGDAALRELKVGLTRIMAQHLANALLEYTGARAKGFSRDKRTIVGAKDLMPAAGPSHSRGPVRLSASKKSAAGRF